MLDRDVFALARELDVRAAETTAVAPVLALLDFFEILVVSNHDVRFEVEGDFRRSNGGSLGF